MNTSDVWKTCRSLPGSTDQIQWVNDRVFKVGEKMYACTGLKPDSPWSVKVEVHRFLELTDQQGVKPAPYLARFHWVQIDPKVSLLADTALHNLLRNSHTLVLAKLGARKRREILGVEDR